MTTTQTGILSRALPLATLIVLGISVGYGCGSSLGPEERRANGGWVQFEAGNYGDALGFFLEAIAIDSTHADAYLGAGWASARLDELSMAQYYFNLSDQYNDDVDPDELAGFCAVANASGNHNQAFYWGRSVTYVDTLWVFSHDPTVDIRDIRLIIAQSGFALGGEFYEIAQEQVDYLDPGNGIEPDNPETWNGYPSYTVALLHEIALLEELVGASAIL